MDCFEYNKLETLNNYLSENDKITKYKNGNDTFSN